MLAPDGRVIMVTGANRGIGRAIAGCLHDKGYTLSLGARDVDALEGAVADIAGDRVTTHHYNATDPASNAAWVDATVERFGRIDGLVNNAGIALDVGIKDDNEDGFDLMWAVNAKGPLRMIRLTLPHLKQTGAGRIVNVASLSGKRVANLAAGYAMSKFAVMALSHAARRAGWDDGVRVTALCPGYVATDMTSDVTAYPREDMIEPGDLAELAAITIALPNTASVAEMLVNCRFEAML